MFDIFGRVRQLRQEIDELKVADEIHKHKRGTLASADRQRQEVRLRDIQLELADLTARLKPKA